MTDDAKTTEKQIFRVVLTGGPCGGKTTSSSIISERFQALGWRVFIVPEAASLLLSGGVNFYNLTADQVYNFQTNLLKVMMSLENSFYDIAKKSGQKCLVICDRGALDCSAYTEPENWQAIMDENGWTSVGLRDSRYDCVIHLVSAADGAPEFYTLDDSIRTETVEEALKLDKKISEAWVGHPLLAVIDNSTDFKRKIERVVASLCQFVGETVPISEVTKRKFLVKSSPADFPIKHQDYHVQHDYLKTSDGTQARLRKRGQYGTFIYTHTIRFPEKLGQRLQLRRNLTGREYILMRDSQSDKKRNPVLKTRRSFIYKNQYYELDTFTSCQPGLMLLEAYIPAEVNVKLPNFLEVVREVTKEKQYSMYEIALKDTAGKSLGEQLASQYRSESGVGGGAGAAADVPKNSQSSEMMVDTAGHFGVK